MVRRSLIVLALWCTASAPVAGFVPTAAASSGAAALADCNAHNQLTHHYTAAQLKAALSAMPADVKEYTDCYDVIERALLTQLGQYHPAAAASSGSGGSFLSAPVIVVLAVLVLSAAAFGGAAMRRRGG